MKRLESCCVMYNCYTTVWQFPKFLPMFSSCILYIFLCLLYILLCMLYIVLCLLKSLNNRIIQILDLTLKLTLKTNPKALKEKCQKWYHVSLAVGNKYWLTKKDTSLVSMQKSPFMTKVYTIHFQFNFFYYVCILSLEGTRSNKCLFGWYN